MTDNDSRFFVHASQVARGLALRESASLFVVKPQSVLIGDEPGEKAAGLTPGPPPISRLAYPRDAIKPDDGQAAVSRKGRKGHRDLTNSNIAWSPKKESLNGDLIPGAVALAGQSETTGVNDQYLYINGACESDVVRMSFENRVEWLRQQLTKMQDHHGVDLRQVHPVLLGLAEYRAMLGHDVE